MPSRSTAKRRGQLTDGLNKLGAKAREMGMVLTYHHHMGTGCRRRRRSTLDGRDPASSSASSTTPATLVFSGEDEIAVLKKWLPGHPARPPQGCTEAEARRGDRLQVVLPQERQRGGLHRPRDGCIDFEPIFTIIKESGYHEGGGSSRPNRTRHWPTPWSMRSKREPTSARKRGFDNSEPKGFPFGSSCMVLSHHRHISAGMSGQIFTSFLSIQVCSSR